MKGSIFLLCLISGLITGFILPGCHEAAKDNNAGLQTEIDSLQRRLDNTYKPGLGEFMTSIQMHHAKLWFAGKAENWKLAGFEIGEIKESLDDIRQYCTDRPELVSLPMITAPIDSLSNAIAAGSEPRFKSSFILLTNTCNNCHRATNHAFNVIKIPDIPPVSNQVFENPR